MQKVSASSFDAFASPNCEALAKITAMGADVNWNLIRRPKSLAKFSIQTNLDTAHVACLRIFPGIKPESKPLCFFGIIRSFQKLRYYPSIRFKNKETLLNGVCYLMAYGPIPPIVNLPY